MSVRDIVIFRGTVVRVICIHCKGVDVETSTGIQFVNIDPEDLKPVSY